MTRLITHALFSTHDIRHEYALPRTNKQTYTGHDQFIARTSSGYICICMYVCIWYTPYKYFCFYGLFRNSFRSFVSGEGIIWENKVFTMPAIVRVLSRFKGCKRFQ